MRQIVARAILAGARPARPWLIITRPWWWTVCRCDHWDDLHQEPGCMGVIGPEFCPCPRFRRNWFGWWG